MNFALSKLLAHRAGDRLETLVTDEGFEAGARVQGCECRVEVITGVQHDFRRILKRER